MVRFNAPGSNPDQASFGTLTSQANQPRRLQLNARERFYFAFAISTANTWTGPSMLDRNTIHFMSGEKVTFGSSL